MKSTLECPLCGSEVDEHQDYCPECGETLGKASMKTKDISLS